MMATNSGAVSTSIYASQSLNEQQSSTQSSDNAAANSTVEAQFFDDDNTNTFGIMKKEKYVPKSDFKMEFITMVEALENTGYIVDVTREVDNQKRRCYFTMSSLTYRGNLNLLSKSFGSGGLMCTFSDRDMAEYIKHKKTLFHESHSTKYQEGGFSDRKAT
jgi:hypothetical protein